MSSRKLVELGKRVGKVRKKKSKQKITPDLPSLASQLKTQETKAPELSPPPEPKKNKTRGIAKKAVKTALSAMVGGAVGGMAGETAGKITEGVVSGDPIGAIVDVAGQKMTKKALVGKGAPSVYEGPRGIERVEGGPTDVPSQYVPDYSTQGPTGIQGPIREPQAVAFPQQEMDRGYVALDQATSPLYGAKTKMTPEEKLRVQRIMNAQTVAGSQGLPVENQIQAADRIPPAPPGGVYDERQQLSYPAQVAPNQSTEPVTISEPDGSTRTTSIPPITISEGTTPYEKQVGGAVDYRSLDENWARGREGREQPEQPTEPTNPPFWMDLAASLHPAGGTFLNRWNRKQKMRDLSVDLSMQAMKNVTNDQQMKDFLQDKELTAPIIQRYPQIEDKDDIRELLQYQIDNGIDLSDVLGYQAKGLLRPGGTEGTLPFQYGGKEYGLAGPSKISDRYPELEGTAIGNEQMNSPSGLKEQAYQNQKRKQVTPSVRFVPLEGELRIYQTNKKDAQGNFIPIDLQKPDDVLKDDRVKSRQQYAEKMKLTEDEVDEQGVLHKAGTEITWLIDKKTMEKRGPIYFDGARRSSPEDFMMGMFMGDMNLMDLGEGSGLPNDVVTSGLSKPTKDMSDEDKANEEFRKQATQWLGNFK
jgi:hypothetical protein